MNITVSGSSAVSGIAKYQYTTNGGETWIDMTTTEADEATATTPYNAKKASLLLDYDVNALTFSFRAVSNAGNVGAESPGKVVKIDKFKPVMVINGNNSDYKQSDTITFDLEFGNSGIMFMTVCKDYGDRVTITDSYQDGYTVTENGLYLFEVFSMAGKVTSETIYYGNLDSAKPVISINSNGYEEDSWQNNGNVTLNVSNATANLGTTLIQYKVGSGSWQNYTSPIVISNDTAAALYTFKATSASGVVSDEKTLTIKRDTVIPDGDIKIKENSVKKFINTISFGLFFKENVDVTISSTDVTSGVESVKYYRSDRILTQAELNEISSWEDYTGTISETAADAEKFVYYVKVTDYAGNVDLFGSDGVTFDTSAPFVSGIEDGKAYTPDTEVTVSDATDVTVTLNGNSITLQDNKFSLTGQTGSVTVEATDAAGNKTTLAITVNEEGLLIDTVNHPDGSVTVTRTNNDGKVVEILITYSDGSTDQILNNTDGTSVETKKDNSGNVTETTVTQADGSFIKTENKPDGSVVETNMDNSGKVTETTVSQEDGSSVKTENKSDGSVVETKKDSSGEVTETTVTQADGSSVKTENKSDGSVVETKKDGSGNITETTVTQADGSSVKTESKPDGSMVETKKDGSGNVTETTVTQTDGSSVKTENKSDGSVVETKKDNSGAVTEKTVIAANGSKTITIHNADGTTTVTKYDPDGKVINDKDTDNPAVPHTGDSNNMILWIALLFVSGGIIITLDIAGKHRKRRI
jgi:YD repeat-containing protein